MKDQNLTTFPSAAAGLPFDAMGATSAQVLHSEDTAEQSDGYKISRDATVMMVDDEPTTIEVIQAFLEVEGYRNFVTTSDPSDALEIFFEEQPDVLLLDLHMPGVSGFDILTKLRAHQRYRHTPVIVLTSSTDSETKLSALHLGATDFLAKPVDPSELALRLRNTLAAKSYQDRLTYFDLLTDLPNRRLFMDRLNRSVRHAKNDGNSAALLHVDLDHFKKINDTLGHAVGDRLLVAVARRLKRCLVKGPRFSSDQLDKPQALVARMVGDEFAMVLPVLACVDDAKGIAADILNVIKEPFSIDGREVFVSASVGVAVFPNDGDGTDLLVQHASVAMNQAKLSGRNACEFYSAKMNARALERLDLETQLRRALERNELELFYQPKVEFITGRVVGSEALLRWNHPERGLVSPVEFIPLAEETGLIVPFGAWVLRMACQQTRAWQHAGLTDLRVAVNVAAQQFRDGRFIQTVRAALEESRLDPECLTLELTESTLMTNERKNLEAMQQIKELGVKLSVDDFGTGYSSLCYLKQMPLDELKVDRSFIKDIQCESDDAPIASAIIAMAHSLGLKVVVEGIENEPQLAYGTRRGCEEYQGFYFSKPVPSKVFHERWLEPRWLEPR